MCETKKFVYLDHAATSFPKPAPVITAVADFLTNDAVNPGRAGYDLAMQTNQKIDGVRKALGQFFGNPAQNLNHTIFTANATDALNVAISGYCRQGDHVVSTTAEHNSVLRPLHMLARAGKIDFDLVACDKRGFVSPQAMAAAITPHTRLVVMTHSSNVVGSIQPVAKVGAMCREKGVKFLVDAAQTAGSLPLDMESSCVDMVAFTGHKGLQASPGIGGLIVGPDVELQSTRWGGTGVRSALLTQPEEMPYRLEAGTINGAGIMSLRAGLDWVLAKGLDKLLQHELRLSLQFVEGCGKLPKITLHGHGAGGILAEEAFKAREHMPIVSFTVDGMDSSAVGMFLDMDGNVAVRTGLHCAPMIHKALGTDKDGTVRVSFGPGNTENDVEQILQGLADIT